MLSREILPQTSSDVKSNVKKRRLQRHKLKIEIGTGSPESYAQAIMQKGIKAKVNGLHEVHFWGNPREVVQICNDVYLASLQEELSR